MGFYSPALLVLDARQYGVEARPIDVNYSYWDNTLEEKSANSHVLRLGLRQVKGLAKKDIDMLLAGRTKHYININEIHNAGVPGNTPKKLAKADAFNSMGFERREALWQTSAKDKPFALFKGQPSPDEKGELVALPMMSKSEHPVNDYEATLLSLRLQAVSCLRKNCKSFPCFLLKK